VMLSGPPRCSRRNGAQNATRWWSRGALLRERWPRAYNAVESASWYASQRRSLSTAEALLRRIPAKRRSTSCNVKLSNTRIWIAHSFQRSIGHRPICGYPNDLILYTKDVIRTPKSKCVGTTRKTKSWIRVKMQELKLECLGVLPNFQVNKMSFVTLCIINMSHSFI
jgi:hypothetical protein